MSLERLQNEFIDYLYTLKPKGEQQERIRAYFLDPNYPDPHGGLKVYRGNLLFSILGAMSESYPMTKVLLGENNFNFFARLFLYGHPSTNSDLIQYGAGFGEFLAQREELKDIAFVADIARLEWALERVFYSAPEASYMGEPVADWQKNSPRLKGSVRLVSTHFKVHEAWLGFTEKGEEGVARDLFKSEVEHLVIWSDNGTPRVTPINPVVAQWVEGTLLESPVELPEEQALQAYRFALKQGWISQK